MHAQARRNIDFRGKGLTEMELTELRTHCRAPKATISRDGLILLLVLGVSALFSVAAMIGIYTIIFP